MYKMTLWFQNGTTKIFLCEKCAKKANKNNLEKITRFDLNKERFCFICDFPIGEYDERSD